MPFDLRDNVSSGQTVSVNDTGFHTCQACRRGTDDTSQPGLNESKQMVGKVKSNILTDIAIISIQRKPVDAELLVFGH